MKRDMDLAREILMRIEEHEDENARIPLDFPERTSAEVHYHLYLLAQAGLIVAVDASNMSGLQFIPRRLTWAGHDFLDASRNSGIWEKAKRRAIEGAGGLPFDVLLDLLKRYAREAVGLGS